MAYPSSSGGGKRRSTLGRKSAKKTANEDDDDGESETSESNTFGFVASNTGEKPWGKVKTSSHHPSSSNTPRPSRTLSLFPSPSSASPSHKKIRCVDQRESQTEEKLEHNCKKRRASEGNPNSPLDLHWLG